MLCIGALLPQNDLCIKRCVSSMSKLAVAAVLWPSLIALSEAERRVVPIHDRRGVGINAVSCHPSYE
jgi:hypothetical protein